MRLALDRILAPLGERLEDNVHDWRTFSSEYPHPPDLAVWHHTVGAVSTSRPFPSEHIIVEGRGKPNPVPPRLCNILIGWNGHVKPVCSGQANHAGDGMAAVLPFVTTGRAIPAGLKGPKTGGSCRNRSIGIEVEHPGIAAVPWPDVVVDSSLDVAALLSIEFGWNHYHHIEHKQWAPTRKTDRVFTTGLPSEEWWYRELDIRIAELAHPTVPPTTQRPVLRVGSQGADVAYLQGKLGLTANGYFGSATDAKVRSLQATARLTVDGVVGPQTWAVITKINVQHA